MDGFILKPIYGTIAALFIHLTSGCTVLNQAKTKLDKLIKTGKKAAYPQLLPHLLKGRLSTYAPFVGAGIRMDLVDLDNGLIVVSMPLTRLNKNIVGTQFGGSLFMMTDPFIMMLLMHKLGRDYVVWDKSACIDYIAPARSTVTARIKISTEEVLHIIELAKTGEAVFRDYHIEITDADNHVIATVKKTLYIRLKSHSHSVQDEPDFS